MFSLNTNFYYITVGMQAACVIHCLWKGRETSWIWLIIFLPLIGSLAYFVMEILGKNQSVQQLQSGMGNSIGSFGRIGKLQKQLAFADTFNNRILLADAYLAAGETDSAIQLYEQSLTGAFTENEHVLLQLITAYYEKERYTDAIRVAKTLYSKPQFQRSHSHVLYAVSLAKTGQTEQAEKEFSTMRTKYSFFEARYRYALFLWQQECTGEARKMASDLIDEFPHLGSFEKRNNRSWYRAAKKSLKEWSAPPQEA